jgi:hypothetical protein
MDGQQRVYRRLIGENALQVLLRVDCSDGKPSIEAQVQDALERCRDTLVKDHNACDLILNSSDSPTAQSYRNIRHSNMSEMLWAGSALVVDLREVVADHLRGNRGEHPASPSYLLAWKRRVLRADFSEETPWSIIADWYDDLGDSFKADLCRSQDVASND